MKILLRTKQKITGTSYALQKFLAKDITKFAKKT